MAATILLCRLRYSAAAPLSLAFTSIRNVARARHFGRLPESVLPVGSLNSFPPRVGPSVSLVRHRIPQQLSPRVWLWRLPTRVSTSFAAVVLDEHDREPHLRTWVGEQAFEVTSDYVPTGDQPEAIEDIVRRVEEGDRFSILRGVTGTGKTFVASHVIARLGRPTLVLCHNKTLAAQLARELRSFLGKNAVELFVSYYDHYVPESFVEQTGQYIAKKSSVNDEIDSLRHRATRALLERRDVVVVGSVSCIYGLGLPTEYLEASVFLSTDSEVNNTQHHHHHHHDTVGGTVTTFDELLTELQSMLYAPPENGEDMLRGNFIVSKGLNDETDIVTLWPPHEQFPMRLTFGNQGQTLLAIEKGTEGGLVDHSAVRIFPARHHVTSQDSLERACLAIEEELADRIRVLRDEAKYDEAARLQQRVMNDVLMLRETGYCSGAENYSRHFDGRDAGEPPDTLLNYFKLAGGGGGSLGTFPLNDWLLIVDESHVALPQLRAMYDGDRARKEKLVKHGYRLPSALDNRPLRNSEFWDQVQQAIFVSATPSRTELAWAERDPVEMIIRPTFVCDPVIHVRPSHNQLEDLVREIQRRSQRNERTLAISLTKRDAEDLARFLTKHSIKSDYIHSDLTTVERANALKSLQSGQIDCLVGVNLLREGLDLPQVSLVAVLNADSEGFLRSQTSLLQTVGRAARNVNGEAVFYANRITASMRRCLEDTKDRRERQMAYNARYHRESRNAMGSDTLSIFDLLREEMKKEQEAAAAEDTTMSTLRKPDGVYVVTEAAGAGDSIVTDHLPSKPGVYFWKDANGNILYIGKAKKVRSRVRSYLSDSAKHTPRIQAMLRKAARVECILTPSDRDALVLESNLIKEHQPPYNVLMKDDKSYPYICASVGDRFPRFFAVPRKFGAEMGTASKYRYFGPYPHYNEINAILEEIEDRYDLRSKSFAARHGEGDEDEYNELFGQAMKEIFEQGGGHMDEEDVHSLRQRRAEYEEAGLLFDNEENTCRDVVAMVTSSSDRESNSAIVMVIQLRDRLVAGKFTYACELPAVLKGESDYGAVLAEVLTKQHYETAEECPKGRFSFFPDEILVPYPIPDSRGWKQSVRASRKIAEPSRQGRIQLRVARQENAADHRAMEFALSNAEQEALQRLRENVVGATLSSVDGTASEELARLLSLDSPPRRIECFDISHTQGAASVGSRVVFVDGKPARHLYRKFNVKTVEGVDDYGSMEEVLERRFQHAWNAEGGLDMDDDAWSLPDLVVVDGGVGQLGAAVKGMVKARVFPSRPDSIVNHENHNDDDAQIVEEMVSSLDSVVSVPICALAKNQEEVFALGRKESVNETPDSPALLLLRALRDESHRFALSSHRRRRAREGGFR